MAKPAVVTDQPFSLMTFLTSVADLGDVRLNARFCEMAERCLTSAKGSLPAMFGQKGTKAAQRFMSNPRVDVLDLRKVLYACSQENMR